MAADARPYSRKILEDYDCRLSLAVRLQRMGQLVGRLGAERPGRRVVADRPLTSGELFKRPGQIVVDPHVVGVELLGPTQHRFGPRRVARVFEGPAQEIEADRP